MSDFRNGLYEGYVSTFKRHEIGLVPPTDEAAWKSFDFKYLPHLQHLAPHDPILEVGCGPGTFVHYLGGKGFRHVEGLDISREQVELAKARGLRVECGDVLPFLEQNPLTYQAIIAIDFVEHFTKEEVLRLFPALFRALKSGGVLLLQTPNGEGLFPRQIIYGDLTHCTIFTPGSLLQALRLAGFKEAVFDETGPIPKDWKGRLRLLSWSLLKSLANFVRLIEAGKRQNLWTENLICCCRKP